MERHWKVFPKLPPWTPISPSKPQSQLLPPTSEPEIEAITAIQNLANTVIANAASRSLARYSLYILYNDDFDGARIPGFRTDTDGFNIASVVGWMQETTAPGSIVYDVGFRGYAPQTLL